MVDTVSEDLVHIPRRAQPLVLVVDDDAATRTLISEALQAAGFGTLEAIDGEHALAMYRDHRPDLVVLDILMPKLDGFETCVRIRRIAKGYPVPVLIQTGVDDISAVTRAFQAGATDFCSKPPVLPLLVEKVRHALKERDIELDLLESRNKLSHSQRLAGMGYWEYDPAEDRVFFSDELCHLFGLQGCEAVTCLDDFFRDVHPEDRRALKDVLDKAIAGKQAYAIEHRMIDRDGVEYIVQHQGKVSVEAYDGNPYLVGTLIDITERRDAQSLIESQNFFDQLTGLPNRFHFTDKLSQRMAAAQRDEHLLGVMFLGLDRFKNINDSLGHSAGDELLKQIAQRLVAADVGIDLVSRFSGDIFAFVMERAGTVQDIDHIAEQVIGLFAAPFKLEHDEFFLSVSVGGAIFPFIDEGREVLIKAAETAMFHAKKLGSNRYVRFSAELDSRAHRRLSLETCLRKALDRDEFRVHYQPQVAVQNQRIIGMEALVRWERPGFGLVPPDEFIPIAEETGLIIPIGSWVMDAAASQVAQWVHDGFGLLRVGINLSARQFEERNLVKEVEQLISRTGLMPCCLDMEITESAAMNNLDNTIKILDALKELGVQASMDDFGTGYSSLSYLHKLPLETLKIDRAFISKISDEGDNGELAKIIISMCQVLGLNVIAEGVETVGQMRFLDRCACSEAQGYFISRPLPAHQFTTLLRENTRSQEANEGMLAFF